MNFHPSAIAAVMNLHLLQSMPGLREEAFKLIKFVAKNAPSDEFNKVMSREEERLTTEDLSNLFFANTKIKFISDYLRQTYPELQKRILAMSLTTISEENFRADLDTRKVTNDNEVKFEKIFEDVTEVEESEFNRKYNRYTKSRVIGQFSLGNRTPIQLNNTSASIHATLEELRDQIKVLQDENAFLRNNAEKVHNAQVPSVSHLAKFSNWSKQQARKTSESMSEEKKEANTLKAKL